MLRRGKDSYRGISFQPPAPVAAAARRALERRAAAVALSAGPDAGGPGPGPPAFQSSGALARHAIDKMLDPCGRLGALIPSSLKSQTAANDIGIIQPPPQHHPAFDGIGWTWAEHSFGSDSLVFFLIILARYFLAAGGCWYLIRVYASRVKSASSELQNRRIRDGIHHDIRLSVLSAAVFAVAAAAMLWLQAHGMTRLYTGVEPSNWWYLGVSYLTVLILQDTAFYFTHRLFHHPVLYSLFHRGHHRSVRPTPWTSFAFDPPEALVQSLFLVVVVMLIPLHLITLLAVLSTMTVWAIVNHLDLDDLPRRFPHHWLGRWVIGPAHHALHHHRSSVHFGLYFTFWDQVCSTHDAGYSTGLNASTATT